MNIDLETWLSRAREAVRSCGLTDGIAFKITAPAYPDSGYVLDLDGLQVIAQFIIWPSGTVEARCASVTAKQIDNVQHVTVSTEAELDKAFDDFLRIFMRAEKQESAQAHS